uniref:tumor necrosis factor receptor superfamily member 11B-like n=1 Tax=Solea senegalensis TaxID=28829 RepID=UPI001CD891ED|nr:tumor necrosis factor receptor superfamily member 11B-like [Solea senegalensis]
MTPLPLLTLALLAGLVSLTDSATAPLLTFRLNDPVSGRVLECDRCPPGTHLGAHCTPVRRSVCVQCPTGSFTERWNYIDRCLRCGVCAQNQVVRQECNATNNCQCECKQGFYYVTDMDMCLQHRDCPPGEGALTAGTPDKDTECHVCPDGTFSDVFSAHLNCSQHKGCDAAGLSLLLAGATWHDSVCVRCGELADEAVYLREILPAFFLHHRATGRRLRRIVNHLPSEDGRKQGGASGLSNSELQAQLSAWIASATAPRLQKLPEIVKKAGMISAGERLQNKFSRTDKNLREVCGIGNEIGPSD